MFTRDSYASFAPGGRIRRTARFAQPGEDLQAMRARLRSTSDETRRHSRDEEPDEDQGPSGSSHVMSVRCDPEQLTFSDEPDEDGLLSLYRHSSVDGGVEGELLARLPGDRQYRFSSDGEGMTHVWSLPLDAEPRSEVSNLVRQSANTGDSLARAHADPIAEQRALRKGINRYTAVSEALYGTPPAHAHDTRLASAVANSRAAVADGFDARGNFSGGLTALNELHGRMWKDATGTAATTDTAAKPGKVTSMSEVAAACRKLWGQK